MTNHRLRKLKLPLLPQKMTLHKVRMEEEPLAERESSSTMDWKMTKLTLKRMSTWLETRFHPLSKEEFKQEEVKLIKINQLRK
jgi:hypothetical protein